MIELRDWRDALTGLAILGLLVLVAAGLVATLWVLTQGVGG